MNIFSMTGQHSNAPHDTNPDTTSSSQAAESSQKSSLQKGRGRRLERQNQISLTNRYSSHQLSSTSDQARAAGFLRGKGSPNAGPSSSAANQAPDSARHTVSRPSALPRSSLQRQNANRESPALTGFYTAMLNSNKASRSDPIPDAPEPLPKRLQQKMSELDLPHLKKLNKDLYNYGKLVIQAAKEGRGIDSEISAMDKKLLPLIADAENSRNPGLNLRTFNTSQECYNTIKDQHRLSRQSNQAINMRAVYPPFKGTPDHRIALDIQFRPGHRPSIIAFESSSFTILGPLKQSLSEELPGTKIRIVGNIIQNSNWGCVMFSLNNALKSFKHFDDYTSRLHQGERNIPLPAEFQKHAHSKSYIQGHSKKDNIVTKDKSGPHMETLAHRNMAYRADREDGSYSTSIEGFRLQEIQRAGDFLSAQKYKK